jgi:hypothetical protein
MANYRFRQIGFLIVAVLFVAVVAPVLTKAQNRKEIHERLSLVKYPVTLTFELDGQPLKATEEVRPELSLRVLKFEADADWLRKLTLQLKNASGKTVTYVVIFLRFPQTANEKGRTGVHQIYLGTDPDGKFPRPELRLAPNDTVEISLAKEIDQIKTLVETRLPLAEVFEVEVEMHAALFDDGTMFQAGMMYQRDPNDPRKWNPIPKP